MRENFWGVACRYPLLWQMLLIVSMTLTVLLLMVVPFLESGTDSYYMSVFNFMMLIPLILISLYANWRCSGN